MILPIFRPLRHDELLYGWITDLAHLNYAGDVRGVQRVATALFPYSYVPERRHIQSQESLRKDFIRGIDDSLRANSEMGYSFPEAWILLAYNTVLYSMGVSRTASTQARYLYTALSSVYGDIMDMPTLPSSVKSIKTCPACMSENSYIRTWHHLPGVDVCAVHRIKLLNWEESGDDCTILPEGHPDVVYAQYCKTIYDHPSSISLKNIKKMLKPYCTPEETAILSRKSTRFQAVVEMLIRYNVDYHVIVQMADIGKPSSYLEGYRVLKEGKGIVEVSCNRCGKTFTGVSSAIEAGFGCPVCMRSVHPNNFVSDILKTVGDGNYKLTMPFQGMGAVQDVVHKTCGQSIRVRMASRLWDKQVCRCETANKLTDMQRQINSLSAGFKIVSYHPTKGTTTVSHRCGGSWNCNWLAFKSHPRCPYCKSKDARESNYKQLAFELGEEYIIKAQSPGNKGNTFVVMHKPCGTIIQGKLKQFQGTAQKGPKRCPICNSYFKSQRFSGLTAEGELYLEMQKWFKSHKAWISRRHPEYHSKSYYDALIVLEKKSLIYRVSPGVYSNSPVLSVYDVLREKYLLDNDGKICGRFTGEAADYLGGKAEEPEVITLESTLLVRKSVYRTIICERKVDVKGC